MSTFKMIIRKSIAWIGAIVTLTVLLILMSEASYAANYPIEITFNESLGETTYDLYYVGTFGENGKFVFVDDQLQAALGDPPNYKKEPGKEDEWRENWLNAASTAKEYITSLDSPNKYLVESKRTDAKTFTFDGTFEEGFYLIVGSSVKTKDPDTGKITFCWPMPMYIRVLNGKAEYSLKPAYGYANTLSVMKVWDDEGYKDLRPESITIHRQYIDGERVKVKEDITLPKIVEGEEVWYYEWDPEEDELDPNAWDVTEEITPEIEYNYAVKITSETVEGKTQFTVTNTYARQALEITKTMQDYINNRDDSLQDFVFEISGYAKAEDVEEGKDPIYHHYSGLSFGINSPAEDTAFVGGIPATVTYITVKETYSGNYKPDGDTTVVAKYNEDDKVWEAEFTNVIRSPENPPSYNTGVINKYSITGDGQFSFRGTDRDPEQEVK